MAELGKAMGGKTWRPGTFVAAATLLLAAPQTAVAQQQLSPAAVAGFKRYCFDCHGAATAEAQVNIERLAAQPAFNRSFKTWQKVAAMLASGKMPPEDADQPTPAERNHLAAEIQTALDRTAQDSAGDPGIVPLRRLTSAEYAYTIRDLTRLDLDLSQEFVSDAAGGEGFTNVGAVQFFDDAGLERYLEAAKKVADHAVIGAGPLAFFADPGQTGLELSAIDRIRRIYRAHGFRTAAGEGGVPFGLDHYPRAYFVTWKYRHREALGLGNVELESLAAEDGVPPRFARHVWTVLTAPEASFPTSEVIAQFRSLPAASAASPSSEQLASVRKKCEDLYATMNDWQTRLAKAVGDEEEAAILSENAIQVRTSQTLVARFAWMDGPPKIARLQFSAVSANPGRVVEPVVLWKNPRLRYRRLSRRRDEPQPLATSLPADLLAPLQLGRHPRGGQIGPHDLATAGEESRVIELVVPEDARGLEVLVDVELDLAHGEDCVVRASVSEGADAEKTKSVSTLLANPQGTPFARWRDGVVDFARLLPQVSHREPAPSDRDPIPAPFDNTYNMPERNYFHTHVKYCRDDDFLTRLLLDDATRQQLDDAWADLLGSFEYHDIWLRFIAKKFQLDLAGRDMAHLDLAHLDDAWIDSLPAEPRVHIRRIAAEHRAGQARLLAGQSHHLADSLVFAERAWRRPLAGSERATLGDFYQQLTNQQHLGHTAATRALLTRILMSPAFLFRADVGSPMPGSARLSDWELASRLSYFLWSSAPDEELLAAAASGQLNTNEMLEQQTRRLLKDEKARRLATEFFGQWLGFYQFDRFRGVDPDRFPEFDDRLRQSLYDESIAFFEHIVRASRPLEEILFADYAFLNTRLAQHYGLDGSALGERCTKVENVSASHRGGLLALGSIMAATSAPLRTSPVKRGDWILRRVLGTPVPPPPANVGSIAADDTPADGQTVRQRLEAHRRDAACMNCHSRIDPPGFALEHYDTLGRWRAAYRDGQPIDDVLTLADGRAIAGPDGLKAYLKGHQDQFYRTLSTKLLAYALGRSELAGDRDLMNQMLAHARTGQGNLADLIVDIVHSPQFRNRHSQKPRPVTDHSDN